MAEFNTTVKNQGEISTVYLQGYLDAHSAPNLEEIFNGLINKGKYKIIANFHDLAYISSAGLGVFMAFIEKVRENDGDIKLSSMSEKVYNIFDLLGFPLLYEIFDTEEQAINKFKENENLEDKR
jgi:anti-sigma B factor antagonist